MSQPRTSESRSAPRDTWESFIASRFDVGGGDGGIGTLSSRLSDLDLELELFQEQIVVAKRRRNSVTPCCRLPPELLAIVFSALQAVWQPARLSESNGAGSRNYGHGWMTVTHVCHSWRKAGLSARELWTHIDCVNLPTSFTATMLSRSRTMPLSLTLEGSGLSPEVLSNWLYAPVLRRTRELSITDMSISEFGACIRHLNSPMPELEELTLALPITVRLSADLDAHLTGASYPCLQRLTVRGLALNWSWPMFSSNLTHLELLAHTREMMLSAISLEPQLLPVISNMSRLQSLHLIDVLPEPAPIAQYELPRSLHHLLSASTNSSLATGHVPLLERSRCATYFVQVGNEDQSVLTPIIREMFRTWDSVNHPAMELALFNRHISVFYAGIRPRSLWRVKIDVPIGFTSVAIPGTRYLHVAEPHRTPMGRGWKLSPYLHLIPMDALQVVSLASTVATLNFPNPEAWIDAFAAASNVRRLLVSYRRIVNLFLALTTTTPNGDAHDDSRTEAEFALFPRLETLVLHDGLATQKDDIALMDFLHVRESKGAKMQELMVEENLLSLTNIWDSAEEVTTVTYFKACSTDDALGSA
ncbi:hypothetical protein PENSPDRAFT_749133 [Peniophora sp. CONT]|nr:hypothetical protein PENSPDRAFT_749133 [Peniophora sp. CONT]